MLKALNQQSATAITICWRNNDPGGAQFDNDMQAFQLGRSAGRRK
jgi:hypothetical protein